MNRAFAAFCRSRVFLSKRFGRCSLPLLAGPLRRFEKTYTLLGWSGWAVNVLARHMPPLGGMVCLKILLNHPKAVDSPKCKLNLSQVGLLPSLRSRQSSRVSSFLAHGCERFSQGVSI